MGEHVCGQNGSLLRLVKQYVAADVGNQHINEHAHRSVVVAVNQVKLIHANLTHVLDSPNGQNGQHAASLAVQALNPDLDHVMEYYKSTVLVVRNKRQDVRQK